MLPVYISNLMFKAAEGRQYIRQQRPAEQQAAEGRQYIRQHRASSTSGSRGPAVHQAAEGRQYIHQAAEGRQYPPVLLLFRGFEPGPFNLEVLYNCI